MMRPLMIRGVGRYLPSRVVTNEEVGAACGLSAAEVFARCGVVTRRRAEGDAERASVMGALAAREALDEAGLAPHDLDLILGASAVSEQALPDTAPFVQRELGLGGSGVPAMSVTAACLSFLAALDVAGSFLATNRYARILIVSTEVSSGGLDATDPETGPLFGDGAAAVVVTRPGDGDSACLHGVRFETYGEGVTLTEIPGGGNRRPPSHPEAQVADGLFRMRGPALLKVAVKRGRPFLDRFAADLAGVGFEDALLVPHQPSRAGMGLFTMLGFPPERTVSTLEELGNCVSASMPLSLYEAVRSGRLLRGQRALLLGSGAGVTFGAGLLTY